MAQHLAVLQYSTCLCDPASLVHQYTYSNTDYSSLASIDYYSTLPLQTWYIMATECTDTCSGGWPVPLARY